MLVVYTACCICNNYLVVSCYGGGPSKPMLYLPYEQRTGIVAAIRAANSADTVRSSGHHGTLFGGAYSYPAQAGVFGVPFPIIAYWAVFIYTGYWLVTTFLYWFGKQKPSRGRGSLLTLGLVVLADGLAVTAIDLFMDPVSVRAGSWTWAHGGPYFGVPIGNFVGWFGVTVVATGLFRLYEYYAPQREPSIGRSVLLLPVIGYLLVGLDFLAGAISYHLLLLAGIGTGMVIVPALVNLALYATRQTRPGADTKQSRSY